MPTSLFASANLRDRGGPLFLAKKRGPGRLFRAAEGAKKERLFRRASLFHFFLSCKRSGSYDFAAGIDAALSFGSPRGAPRVESSFLGGLFGKSEEVVQYTKSNLRLGQRMHQSYKAAIADKINLRKEYKLPSGRRIDFLDRANGKVYELKPNNPRAIKAGMKQLEMYINELKTMPEYKNVNWEGILEVY